MLISLDRVTDITWSISSNFGTTSFVTDPNLMQDNRPGTTARFVWPTHVPNTAVEVTLEGVFPAARSHIIGMFGIKGLERGNVIEFLLRRDGSAIYDVPIGTVFVEELVDGTHAVWCYVDLEWFYSGIKIKILADNPDMGVVLGGTPIEIGETWLGSKEVVGITDGWTVAYEDSTVFRDTESSSPFNIPGIVRRVFNFTACLKQVDEIYGEHGGLATTVNLDAYSSILTRLSLGKPCVCFPRWQETGFPEEERTLMARAAIFGMARKIGGFNHAKAEYFQPQAVAVYEIPTPL